MPIYKGERCPEGLPVVIENNVNPIISDQVIDEDETVAHEITLDTQGKEQASVVFLATTATTFYLDVSNDNVNWVNAYTSGSVTGYANPDIGAMRYIKARHATAGTSGTDTVSILLSAR